MKHIAVLGSTGSIGTNVLKIVEQFPQLFKIKTLSAAKNIHRLKSQIEQFSPELAVVKEQDDAITLKSMLSKNVSCDILFGEQGYIEAATYSSVHMVISAMVGASGLLPTINAIQAKKDIGLANKETLVMAGDIVMKQVRDNSVQLMPIDSEHSAIFQCLSGQNKSDVAKIYLTASGGPFRNTPSTQFDTISVADALNHPNWTMGKKITIDSATLMNKGLEVIEAKHLFDIPLNQIDVLVHAQSIVHSMVVFKDGSILAQMGVPDMKGAIAYAMSYPKRLPIDQPEPDLLSMQGLTFEQPDVHRFPCLSLAYDASRTGHTMPAVLNAANEVAVEAFLQNQIQFVQIPKLIRSVMDRHVITSNPNLSTILQTDQWARVKAMRLIQML
ncbi:MAG: 1-deoxy-D-xylulose-5-phosphate reductoisomerase [Desulfobacterales bacterium]|nr:1-deoxy-D-xylulose-5-phosphate reductoisomerase [Desulfobacterales bacterium]